MLKHHWKPPPSGKSANLRRSQSTTSHTPYTHKRVLPVSIRIEEKETLIQDGLRYLPLEEFRDVQQSSIAAILQTTEKEATPTTGCHVALLSRRKQRKTIPVEMSVMQKCHVTNVIFKDILTIITYDLPALTIMKEDGIVGIQKYLDKDCVKEDYIRYWKETMYKNGVKEFLSREKDGADLYRALLYGEPRAEDKFCMLIGNMMGVSMDTPDAKRLIRLILPCALLGPPDLRNAFH